MEGNARYRGGLGATVPQKGVVKILAWLKFEYLWFSFKIYQAIWEITSYKNKQANKENPDIPQSWKSRNKFTTDSVHRVVAPRVGESSTKRYEDRAGKSVNWCCTTKPRRWKRTNLVGEACFSNQENRKLALSRRAGPCPLYFSFVPLTHILVFYCAIQSSREKKNLALSPPDLQSKRSPLFQSSFTFTKCWYSFYKSEEISWWKWE